jgi:hypothetical protein
VEGSVQVALLRDDVDAADPDVQAELAGDLGGAPEVRHVATARLLRFARSEQTLWLWFRPDANAMEVIVFRGSYDDADTTVDALVRAQLGLR